MSEKNGVQIKDGFRTEPVVDSVPQVDNAIAVGEDLAFQRRWWKFERGVWVVFGLILLADALGGFGRGPLSKAERQTADGAMKVKYERVERAGTPSVMSLEFQPQAVRNGQLELFVSNTLLRQIGAQRIIPQPSSSSLSEGGVTYTFPVQAAPAIVQFALEPSFPGLHSFQLRLAGEDAVGGKIAIVP